MTAANQRNSESLWRRAYGLRCGKGSKRDARGPVIEPEDLSQKTRSTSQEEVHRLLCPALDFRTARSVDVQNCDRTPFRLYRISVY